MTNINPFTWQGYLTRVQFLITWLAVLIIGNILVATAGQSYQYAQFQPFFVFVNLYCLSCASVKRCRDSGMPLRSFLLLLIPIVNLLYLVYLSCAKPEERVTE